MARQQAKPKSALSDPKGKQAGEAYTVLQAANWDTIRHLVVLVARNGGTVQLGTTQNGSAVTLRLYHGGVGENFYAGDTDALEDLCRHWAEVFESYLD